MRLHNPLARLYGAPRIDDTCAERTTVWWSDDVLAQLIEDAERWSPRETGGALLGYRQGEAVVVRALVLGGPKARHRRSSFHPDGPWQESQIARSYAASGRIDTFLGDAHSHPAGVPRLSRRDRLTLRDTALHRQSRAPRALSAILASEDGRWTLAVWEFGYGRIWPCRVRHIRAREIASVESEQLSGAGAHA